MNLDPLAKILMVVGFAFLMAGVAWQMGWIQSLRLGRLPGDIFIEREGFRFYLPITTCLLLSAVLSFVAWLIRLVR